LITVIDEAMPHRVVGGPAVMAEQSWTASWKQRDCRM